MCTALVYLPCTGGEESDRLLLQGIVCRSLKLSLGMYVWYTMQPVVPVGATRRFSRVWLFLCRRFDALHSLSWIGLPPLLARYKRVPSRLHYMRPNSPTLPAPGFLSAPQLPSRPILLCASQIPSRPVFIVYVPNLTRSLENRQRHKIEEQDADLGRLRAEIVSLKRDHDRLLAENGRFSDAVGELQSQAQSVSVRDAGSGACRVATPPSQHT